MSKIKDEKTAKAGLSGIFGQSPQEKPLPIEKKTLSTKEEVEESLDAEDKEVLLAEIKRRQYLKSGRPPGVKNGEGNKAPDKISMTFRVDPEKQETLREIALRKGLFISEVLDRGIDLLIEECKKEGVI